MHSHNLNAIFVAVELGFTVFAAPQAMAQLAEETRSPILRIACLPTGSLVVAKPANGCNFQLNDNPLVVRGVHGIVK